MRAALLIVLAASATLPAQAPRWTAWWESDGERWLDVPGLLLRNALEHPPAPDTIFGEYPSDREERVAWVRLDRRIQADAAAPVFFYARKLLPPPEVHRACLIALGRVARPDCLEFRDFLLAHASADGENVEPPLVREGAILGLGLQAAQGTAATLLKILRDRPASRPESAPTTPDLRYAAVLALGLIAAVDLDATRGQSVEALSEIVRSKDAPIDLRHVAVLALGTANAVDAAPVLDELVAGRIESPDFRAAALSASARVTGRGAVTSLVTRGLKDDAPEVRRSAARSLGLFAGREDRAAIDALIVAALGDKDRRVRDLAIIALGETGADAARVFVVSLLKNGGPADRAFAALATGIYGRVRPDDRGETEPALIAAWTAAVAADDRAPIALALGISDCAAGLPLMVAELTASKSVEARSYVALGCAMFSTPGRRTALASLRGADPLAADVPAGIGLGTALGLLDDEPFMRRLSEAAVGVAATDQAAFDRVAAIMSAVGDHRSRHTLALIVENRTASSSAQRRTTAAAALGRLAEEDDSLRRAAYQWDSEDRPMPAALRALLFGE